MPTVKVKKEDAEDTTEGVAEDELYAKLGEARDRCCDELGLMPVADIRDVTNAAGCGRCPVRMECRRLWQAGVGDVMHSLSLAEFRRLMQKFHMLKQKRNLILEKRGVVIEGVV